MTTSGPRLSELTEPILRAIDRSGFALSISIESGDQPDRLYIGQAAADLLGYSVEELKNGKPLAHVHPDDLPLLAGLRQQYIAGRDIPARCHVRFVHKDGSTVPCELSLATDQIDGRPIVVAVLRDRRREVAMAEAARESEANFRRLADAAPDSIAVTRHGEILYMNPVGAHILGYEDAAELVGQNLGSFLLPADAQAMRQRLVRIAAGERLAPREYTVRSKSGELVTVEIASIPIDFHGEPANLAIGREVSERKLMQAELMQADRMATVGTLAAGVAHEINNPLTYVLLHLERLWRRLPPLISNPEALREIMNMVSEAMEGAERMTSIVRDLLAFSHPDDRDQRNVDVRLVVDSTVKLASTGLKHRANIVTSLDRCPSITCNPSKLGQVVLNILVNALQAVEGVPREGEVEISLRPRDDRWLILEVCDNGPGIAPDALPRIFDPFFTTKPVGTGTGLGLPISKSIAENMGGTLAIENRSPHGVRVVLTLPLGERLGEAPTPAPAPRPHRTTDAPPLGAVLIVDDEPAVARALASLLDEHYATEICTDSAQALELLLGERTFDAVFCDVSMPAPTGIDIFERVTQHDPTYARRFAFITGGATTERTAKALEVLEAPVLAKPFEVDAVLALAAKLVRAT